VTHQRCASPVLSDMAEHAVLDLVPLAGAGRKVTDLDRHLQPLRQVLQRHLPQAGPAGVAAAPVCGDQELRCMGVAPGAHLLPPAVDGLRGELRRVVVDAHAEPTLVAAEVVHAVGDRLAQLGVHEVVGVHRERLTLGLPLAPAVLELAHQLLLLRVHRDDRLRALLHALDRRVDVLELRVAIRVVGTLFGLAVALQAEAGRVEQSPHSSRTQLVALLGECLRQFVRALARPTQRRHRVATGARIDQPFQSLEQLRIGLGQPFAATARAAQSRRHGRIGFKLPNPQLGQAFADRLARHPRGTAHRAHTAPAIGLRFSRRPMPPHPFIHQ
jgi:hypothetical protein